jgi:hypothetical protein
MEQEAKVVEVAAEVGAKHVCFVMMAPVMAELVAEVVAKVVPVAQEDMVEEHLLRYTYTTMEEMETSRIVF